MKKTICIILALVMMLSTTSVVFAAEVNNSESYAGEQKFYYSNLPKVSASFLENSIPSNNCLSEYSGKNVQASDELIDELGALYLSLERLEDEYEKSPNTDVLNSILKMKSNIERLEEDILNTGAIELTQEQVNIMFSDVNMGNEATRSGEYCPANTSNTRFYLYGPYTISTSNDSCKYYYVTATAISSSSSMVTHKYITMNSDKVSQYVNAVTDVYVSKVAGSIVGSLAWWTKYLPWELLLDPPKSHYTTTATYTIDADYVTNAKFVWVYSPTLSDYFLGVVLNSTSVREVHNNKYTYSGKPYGTLDEKNYTINCDNYNNIANVTRKYWESEANIHIEYIKNIQYNYNGSKVTAITPKHAEGYYSVN